jgi:hypothetical protein
MTRQSPANATTQRLRLEALVTKVGVKSKVSPETGLHGWGRTGADFWTVLKDKRGRKRHYLSGRYKETAWGQLAIHCCGRAMLAAGAKGPVSTLRVEAWRANLQEIEARVFIEKALHDKGKRAKLGDDLARRALELLDTRVRLVMLATDNYERRGIAASDVQGYSRKLYDLAAEVAARLGPKP